VSKSKWIGIKTAINDQKSYKKFDLAFGKDEVPSSNLGSSSKIPLESLDSGGILLVF